MGGVTKLLQRKNDRQNTIREDADGVLDFVEQVGNKLRSRRSFIGDAAKVSVGTAALGAVGSDTVAAQSSSSSNVSDVDVLNYALTLEHLEATYYKEFLSQYSEHDVERSQIAKYFARPTLRYSYCRSESHRVSIRSVRPPSLSFRWR